jgi:hypothetical protein
LSFGGKPWMALWARVVRYSTIVRIPLSGHPNIGRQGVLLTPSPRLSTTAPLSTPHHAGPSRPMW